MIKKLCALCLLLLCNSCCTKKQCTGKFLPVLIVKFNTFDSRYDIATIYTAQNNVITDSGYVHVSEEEPSFSLFPFDDYGTESNKTYTLKWNGKTQVISGLNCDFFEEKVKCNSCFPFGKEKETIKTYNDFTYETNGDVHKNDTLKLAW